MGYGGFRFLFIPGYMKSASNKTISVSSAPIFVLIVVAIFLLHVPLLKLPYFGDESGYYIPAARDIWLTGSFIPHSTPSNAHPPLVMAYLALWWKLAGYAPFVTRTAMLVISAFSLVGVFRLARRIANTEVAIASVICTAIYPVFFVQSSLAHLDVAAAALTFWGLQAYIDRKHMAAAIWFSLAGLTKETAILAPLALFGWEWIDQLFRSKFTDMAAGSLPRRRLKSFLLLLPLLPLGAWYLYHYSHTGYVLGNPEFVRYNVQTTLSPLRIALALLARIWQMLGYMGLYALTLAALISRWRMPLRENDKGLSRMVTEEQPAIVSVMLAYLIFMSVIGGAVLARYMLPVVPLAIIFSLSTLRSRVRRWRIITGIVGLIFVLSWFVNPPYGFAFEDNLAYRDYIVLHMRAEHFLELHYPTARILTAWPASGELTQPHLGYVRRPFHVQPIEDFSSERLFHAGALRSQIDIAMVFSTKYEPPHSFFKYRQSWQEWRTRFFGYHRDEPASEAEKILGGHLVYYESRKGQWVGIIELDRSGESHWAENIRH
jgi:4-amino-4-deoxy-L-arabinose transferase-like glycosyltransferase